MLAVLFTAVLLASAPVVAARAIAVVPVAPAIAVLPPAPASVGALVDRASRWVVAIQVEREKDLPPSPFQPRRISPEGRSAYQRPAGCVSGILLDGEGNVLTSHYNVAGQIKSLRVTLATGATFPAALVAASPQDDAALLRIERGGASLDVSPPLWAGPANPPGSASGPRAGQIIFALGRSPDPERITVTRGIVSAIGRNGGRALQTDAELNYGNSGGPIVDLDGCIVALAGFVGHTQPQWGLNSGVGFGTTAMTILDVLPRLKAGENIVAFRPAFLGIQGDSEKGSVAGTKVVRTVAESAAEKAGLKPGDLILAFDGTEIYDFDHLRRLIFKRKPDDRVRLRVRRGEEILEIEALLGVPPP